MSLPPSDVTLSWWPGTSLVTGQLVLAPSVMVGLGVPVDPGARPFWHQISTGVAVHTDPDAAALSAICEVIERDSVALTWILRPPLPSLAETVLDQAGQRLLAWKRRRGLCVQLFDATTDLGVPVVYLLETSEHDPVAQLVGAACHPDPAIAARRALLETTVVRLAVSSATPAADDTGVTGEVLDGATYMAQRARREAFAFLTNGLAQRPRHVPAALPAESMKQTLDEVVRLLRNAGAEPLVFDLTTVELDEVGLLCTRALIPQLQPLSFSSAARYLGHSRLHAAREFWQITDDEGTNPWPQPFA